MSKSSETECEKGECDSSKCHDNGKCCEESTKLVFRCICNKGFTGDDCVNKHSELPQKDSVGHSVAELNSLVLAVFLGVFAILLIALLALIVIRLTRGGRRIVLVEEAEPEDVKERSDSTASESSEETMEKLVEEEEDEEKEGGVRSTASERRRLIMRSRRGRYGRSRSHQPSSRRRCQPVSAAQLLENPPQCTRHLSQCWTCSIHQLHQQQQQQQQLQQLIHLQKQPQQHLQQQQSSNDVMEPTFTSIGSPEVGAVAAFPTYRTNSDVLQAMGVSTQMSIFSNTSSCATPTTPTMKYTRTDQTVL